jgi:hypothetical protein
MKFIFKVLTLSLITSNSFAATGASEMGARKPSSDAQGSMMVYGYGLLQSLYANGVFSRANGDIGTITMDVSNSAGAGYMIRFSVSQPRQKTKKVVCTTTFKGGEPDMDKVECSDGAE